MSVVLTPGVSCCITVSAHHACDIHQAEQNQPQLLC